MILFGNAKGLRLVCLSCNMGRTGEFPTLKCTFWLPKCSNLLAGANNDDPIVHLVTHTNHELKAGSHIEMDLQSIPPSSPTAILKKVWKAYRESVSVKGPLEFTPLWNNPKYPELNMLQGFSTWRQKGIWFFPEIYTGNVFKYYAWLCAEFSLPSKCFYQYL